MEEILYKNKLLEYRDKLLNNTKKPNNKVHYEELYAGGPFYFEYVLTMAELRRAIRKKRYYSAYTRIMEMEESLIMFKDKRVYYNLIDALKGLDEND